MWPWDGILVGLCERVCRHFEGVFIYLFIIYLAIHIKYNNVNIGKTNIKRMSIINAQSSWRSSECISWLRGRGKQNLKKKKINHCNRNGPSSRSTGAPRRPAKYSMKVIKMYNIS